MIKQIKNKIHSIEFSEFGSIVYSIELNNKNILIDTGSLGNRQELINSLNKLKLTPNDIDILILTHNHYDHVENLEIFTNAKKYGNKLDFIKKEILDIKDLNLSEFQIIETPGHTKGSFCILYQDILFSGDTIFHHGYIGRTDFPESDENQMKESLEKIKNLKFEILCPGH